MATKLIANYSKRLGLPGYSSHQFSISVETELTEVEEIAATSERLYDAISSSLIVVRAVVPRPTSRTAPDIPKPRVLARVLKWFDRVDVRQVEKPHAPQSQCRTVL